MEQKISKEEFDELMTLKGKVRGGGMIAYRDYVLDKKGEEGLERLEKVFKKIGYPIEYKKIKFLNFYPIGIEAATLLAIKRLFNFNEVDFQEMGKLQIKSPLIFRLFIGYFFSLERGIKEIQKAWKRQNTVGKLKLVEFNKDKKYIILRVEDFRCHPLHCQVLVGIFSSAIQLILKGKGTCQETECLYDNDKYHEFLIKW